MRDFTMIRFTRDDISMDIKFSLEDETIYMSLADMSTFFHRHQGTILRSINKIENTALIIKEDDSFSNGLDVAQNARTEKIFRQVSSDGKTYKIKHYNLDIVELIGNKINPVLTRCFCDWCKKEIERLKKQLIPIESNTIRFNNGDVELDVKISPTEETVYLTTEQLSILFDTTRENISIHISNIYHDGELNENSTCKEFLQVQMEGNRNIRRTIKFYNLDMIISIGYRVNTKKGIEFRKWANYVLKRFMLDGYVVNGSNALVANGAYVNLINRVEFIDQRLKRLEIERQMFLPNDKVFVENSMFDAHVFVTDLIKKATKKLIIVDPFTDIHTLDSIKYKKLDIECILITKKNKLSEDEIRNFESSFGKLLIKITHEFHDRYIIIDDIIYYHLGSSINYLGNTFSQASKVEDEGIIQLIQARVKKLV
ncbi:MAG: virulence RhuM family protein [Bacilli bacterium]|nr:virulence RhuM family protein [Bacilli bacterium]